MNRPSTRLRAALLAALGAAGCRKGEAPPIRPEATVPTATPATPEASSAGASRKDAPQPVPARPPPGNQGYARGENDRVRRTGRASCDPTIARDACKGTEKSLSCHTDADCKEGPHGKCASGVGQIGTYCGCVYSCASDDECKAGEACVCADALGPTGQPAREARCAPAKCTSERDCGGQECGVSTYFNGCSTAVNLACRTGGDSCQSSKDCEPNKHCVLSDGKWQCQGMTCVIGRPLLVLGEAKRAGLRRGEGWSLEATGLGDQHEHEHEHEGERLAPPKSSRSCTRRETRGARREARGAGGTGKGRSPTQAPTRSRSRAQTQTQTQTQTQAQARSVTQSWSQTRSVTQTWSQTQRGTQGHKAQSKGTMHRT